MTTQLARVPTDISTVVDVGPGEGTYSVLGRHIIHWARWVGVEIHEPYVERFLLGQKYDDLIVGDVREWKPELANYVILLGDVLEHLPLEDAKEVLSFHMGLAQEVYVSVPIVHSPQGSCFGNDHEAHLHQWTWDQMTGVLAGFPGTLESFKGAQVGRWWWRRP